MNNNMKRWMLCLLLAAGCGLTETSAQVVPQWPQSGREAKAGSRWWWMGSAVDKENLTWQMKQLAQAGIGTLEITPIYGVQHNASKNIPFLSEQWLQMLQYVEDEGQRLGIDIDMTTGTGWPFGGPMVKREQSASKLVTETFDVTGDGTKEQTVKLTTGNGLLQCVMAFPQKGTEGQVANLTALADGATLKWTAPTGTWKIIAAYNQFGAMQVKRPSPGSEGLVVDHFSAEAVRAYLDWFDQKFAKGGAPWPHSFFNDSYEINMADWTPGLLKEFEIRRGYKLEENLDLLLGVGNMPHETLNAKQVLADYRLTLAEMLRDNFTRQWTEWAHSHGATTRNQAHGSPGNLIDLYAEADIPETENFYLNSFGIKGLRNDAGFYSKALSSRATLKYASSAAHVTGKPFTSSESMTWLTEHFRTSLSQIKPELDLLFTSGVNHMLFHGTAYSPREAAWPGWKFYAAIDMSPTNSIWADAPQMMKYIERVQSFLQMGQPDNDVLVYAPFANAMHKNTGSFQNRLLLFDINTMGTKMSEVEQTATRLEQMGLDCDYISDRLLMAVTANGQTIQTAAGTSYKAIVVPVSDFLPDSVKAHLDQLEQQGVQIVYGRDVAALAALSAAPEAMRTELGLSVIRRRNATGHHYFVSNLTPTDVEGLVSLAVPFQSVAVFNPMTGDITAASIEEGKVWVSLKSGQSLILQTYDAPLEGLTESAPVMEMASLTIEGPWTLSLDNQSPCQLDRLQTWETLNEQTATFMGTGIYETTFTVSAEQFKMASAGFRLNLGDVRESARVTLNGVYLGCAWSAPFELDCKDAVRQGENTLRIEVTNLPANRIRQMDIDGTVWRIFEDINMSNISTPTYAGWELVPSGLNSKVTLIPLATHEAAVKAEQCAMVLIDNSYYPQYHLYYGDEETLGSAKVVLKDMDGKVFTDYELETAADGTLLLTVKGQALGGVVAEASYADGSTHYAYLPAYGAYGMERFIDFTADESPVCGWDKLKTANEMKGFSGNGKLEMYRSKASGKVLANLYDGFTFSSASSNYYFYFHGYGMNTNNDFTISADMPELGQVMQVNYVQGAEGSTVYEAADSLTLFARCDAADEGLALDLKGNKAYRVYRSLALYTPQGIVDAIVPAAATSQRKCPAVFTLQGMRVVRPTRGIYVTADGRKVVYSK